MLARYGYHHREAQMATAYIIQTMVRPATLAKAVICILSRIVPLQMILYNIAAVDSFERPSAMKHKTDLLMTSYHASQPKS